MWLKEGVNAVGIRPETVLALSVINDVFKEQGFEYIITEIVGPKHGPKSLHYVGFAADIRSWHIPTHAQKELLVDKVRKALGNNRDFEFYFEPTIEDGGKIVRKEHFHFEYQPKG